jgi:CheY-like chemotaxis protein
VLVVEDNTAMRALIRSLVETVTSTIYECGDGRTATTLYERHRPDWVLMDISIPGIDGIAATRVIRQIDAGARIIVVTEHGDDAHRKAAAAAGASGFLIKDDLLELPHMLRNT